MIRGLLRVLWYVGVGPFAGLLAASVAIGVTTLLASGSFRDFSGWEAVVSPPVLIVAYTLGALPALLTAIVGIVIDRQLKGWRHWLWSALSGALISSGLAWAIFGMAPVADGLQPLTFTAVIASAGAAAGFACAAIFDGLAGLRRRR
jgi:hypothetical protein